MDSLQKVGNIGAGMMGAEIALCFALNGVEVLIKDMDLETAGRGITRVEGILTKWVDKGKLSVEEKGKVVQRISMRPGGLWMKGLPQWRTWTRLSNWDWGIRWGFSKCRISLDWTTPFR